MRKCKINIKDTDYELCLNRKSVEWLEKNGFDISRAEKQPITVLDLMFRAGFIANYPTVDSYALMEEYEAEGGDIGEVVAFLIEEYVAFINALTDTKSEKKKKMQIL